MSKYAETAKNFLLFNRSGTLSTLTRAGGEHAGFPFGSVTPYDISSSGEFVIYISLIAEHYKNLIADARASLTVTDTYGHADPQACARATVLMRFVPIAKSEEAPYKERYASRFPDSINFEIEHNFVFMRGKPERIRWIGGFGEIGWVQADDFLAAQADPLAYCGMDIVEHMNCDHHGALGELLSWKLKTAQFSSRIEMVAVHKDGFQISYSKDGKIKTQDFFFSKPAMSSDDSRREIVALLKEARGAGHKE